MRTSSGICPICGKAKRTKKGRKTCGDVCGNKLKHLTWSAKVTPKNHICGQCGKSYHSYKKGRIFCSYGCFLASGGPLRAGNAAIDKRKIYGAKKDANHNSVIEAFRSTGVPVIDLSGFGRGVPDCIVFTSFEEVPGTITRYHCGNYRKAKIASVALVSTR